MPKKLILKIESAIIHVRLMAWHNKLKQRKGYKKYLDKGLVPVAWHSTRG